MATRTGLRHYLRAAFNARPLGMIVPPNWIGLGAFALLGLLSPGFLLIGAGLELLYLGALATNPRFQRVVVAERAAATAKRYAERHDQMVSRLAAASRERYLALAERCRSIVEHQLHGTASPAGLDAQSESLGRLAWVYLRLLLARQSIERMLRDSSRSGEGGEPLEARAEELRERLADPTLGEELRSSLAGQIEILEERLRGQADAGKKLAFVDAELERIRQQVELLREQAVLSAHPQQLSVRLDEITATVDDATRWIREQQHADGEMEDLLAEPPPILAPARARQSE